MPIFDAPLVLPLKDRISYLFVEKGKIDVVDGVMVLIDAGGHTQIPIGMLTALMLEPGTRISHAAVHLAAQVGCLLLWTGEAGVRFYSATKSDSEQHTEKVYRQARLALNPDTQLKVVRKMMDIRFGVPVPQNRSIDQLRGMEGTRMRETYKNLSRRFGVPWRQRTSSGTWAENDTINQCISGANACLNGLVEAAIHAAGYSTVFGFLHYGKALAFVYDIADLVKTETTLPLAFDIAKRGYRSDLDRVVRRECRDIFRSQKTIDKLFPLIEEVLAAGETQ